MLVIVTFVMRRLTRWFIVPSNKTKPILLLLLRVTVWLDPPVIMRPVCCTSAGVYGEGGMKKSAVLVALPCAVATDIRPEALAVGTVVEMEVEVAELSSVDLMLTRTRFLLAVRSKFVPEMVTGVPAKPIVGVNPVIVGAALGATVNGNALVAEPLGVVTPIGPVVAPDGTVVTIRVPVDEATVAAVPLNCTVF